MGYFSEDNVEGFSEEELDQMNEELDIAMDGVEPTSPGYDERVQWESEKIFKSR